jgi:hypothetical protein
MFRTIISVSLATVTGVVASATAAMADPQFCLYENPEKPEENLRYRNDNRVNYPPNAPGCYVVSKNIPQPGGTATILWPDGITTKITIKTKKATRRSEPFSGLATVDGEIADWSAWEEYCFVIRSNKKKICY